MFTMPSVSSTSNLVSRPVSMAEVVRAVALPRTIEPTTAISKERSRSENNTSESAATAGVYTTKGKSKTAEDVRASDLSVVRQDPEDQPPAEKSEIQKAMETQIKELLSNVWKASAKAVDFLLQRETVKANEQALTSLEPAALLGADTAAVAAASGANANGAVISYNAQGGKLSEESTATGQWIDVLV